MESTANSGNSGVPIREMAYVFDTRGGLLLAPVTTSGNRANDDNKPPSCMWEQVRCTVAEQGTAQPASSMMRIFSSYQAAAMPPSF